MSAETNLLPDSEMVPSSLADISPILRVAHDFHPTDPLIADLCCCIALEEAIRIDPLALGSGVHQFRLSLKSWIEKGGFIMANMPVEYLYRLYLDHYWEKILPYSSYHPALPSFDRYHHLTWACQTALVLFKVCEHVFIHTHIPIISPVLRAHTKVTKLARIYKPYNIIPFSDDHPISLIPEIQAVAKALRNTTGLQWLRSQGNNDDEDILNELQAMFGFQKDNVKIQREELKLLVSNAQRRKFQNEEPPDEPPPLCMVDYHSLDTVMDKLLENYKKWCKYLGIPNNLRWPEDNHEEARKRKWLYMGLYLLVWGEAANVRLMPECICYIYHHMAFELYEMLEKRVNEETGEPIIPAYGGEDEAFLKKLVTPIYQTIVREAERGRGGKHSEGRIYDDLNEYFWSTECFTLGWPMQTTTHPFFSPAARKINFVERRSFLHLFRSFDRMWTFYIIILQAMIIIAWNESEGGLRTIFQSFHNVLSIFVTTSALEFAQSLVDIYLSWKAAHNMPDAKLRYILKAVYATIWAAFFLMTYFFSNSYFNLAILIYSLLKIPPWLFYLRPSLETSDNKILKRMKWWYQSRVYVGRGMHEKASSFLKYMMFWAALLVLKFVFSYYAEIQPLVGPTKEIMGLHLSDYRLPELFPPAINKIALVFTLWSPVILFYFMDTQIWYAALSSLVGGFIGFFIRLGEVQTLEMFKTRFQFLSGLFNDRLVPIGEADAPQNVKEARFCQMWNTIITSFREEDLISNREMELMLVPYWKKLDTAEDEELAPIRWPIFLLANKIPIALEMAKAGNNELTTRLDADIYMTSAVKECYASFKSLINFMVVQTEDVKYLNQIFTMIDDHIQQETLINTVNWSALPTLYNKFVQLTDQLLNSKDDMLKISHTLCKMLDVVRLHMMKEELKRFNWPSECFIKLHLPENLCPRDWKENIKRLHLLLTVKDSAMDVPSNLDAQRRLTFFSNSLFMEMPKAPKIRNMLTFSALTPYYSEDVPFTSLWFNSDEWKNFLEQVGCGSEEERARKGLEEELRLWASFRGQTLTRTVRGMMHYRKALELQAFFDLANNEELMRGYEALKIGMVLHDKCQALVESKFTYVVSCQQYGIHKSSHDPRAKDILRLMTMYPSLRVAYVDEINEAHEDMPAEYNYYSTLVRSDPKRKDKDQVLYKIKLPGPPIIGEGKPENQNHAIIFTRGEALQTIDMNQDNYMEEAFKMRNLLQEFLKMHGGVRCPTILGLREHIFTGSVSSLAWFMSNQETSFVTLGQRVLANPLKVRFHYGHPDVFDRVFHLTRGGLSKASKTINLSEDIFAGFNSTLREGNITHHEYIQVGKGRDMGLNQISMFEAKIANGSGEQTLSRDLYRLGNQFEFFRMLSCYFTTVGFYFCSMLTVLTVYAFLYGRLYIVLSGYEKEMWNHPSLQDSKALQTAILSQSAVQMGFLMALPMIMVIGVEKGFYKAFFNFVLMQFQFAPVFFTFQLGTKAHYYGRTLLHGGAEYRGTGRGFVVFHAKFAENYRFYSRSHFVKAFELTVLLLIYHMFGTTHFLITCSIWFMVGSWLFAPFLFNPSGFEWHNIFDDWKDWTKWVCAHDFEGMGLPIEKSWESWWEKEQEHLRHTGRLGSMLEIVLASRFFIVQYGLVYQLTAFENNHSIWVYVASLLIVGIIMFIVMLLGKASPGGTNSQCVFRTVKVVVFLALLASVIVIATVCLVTFNDIFICMLAFISTGWGVILIAQACKPLSQRLGLWSLVRKLAWGYDVLMGLLLFSPVALMAMFSFVPEIQTRVLFNQAFSRGLKVAHILGGKSSANKKD